MIGGYARAGKVGIELETLVQAKGQARNASVTCPFRVADGTRTRDSQDHNLVLYQLNYSHHCR